MNKLTAGPKISRLRQTIQMLRRPYAYLLECAREHGDPFILRTTVDTAIAFSNPEAIRQIFTADPQTLYAGENNARILKPVLGENSLLTLDGERHLHHRRILSPHFHGKRMRVYGDLIREVTIDATANWPEQGSFAVHPAMQEVSLEVIVRAVFGFRGGEKAHRFKQVLLRMLDKANKPYRFIFVLIPLLRNQVERLKRINQRFFNITWEFDQLMADEIRHRAQNLDSDAQDILSRLLLARSEAGEAMDDSELRDELITLLLAGHETTATALAWALYWLHKTPGVLDKLRNELANTQWNSENINTCEYLSAVCKEALRLYPVVTAVGRIVKEPMQVMGYDFDPGEQLVPAILLTHHREDLYPDSMQFRPERFIERQFSPYEFLPFGGGVRRCIGEAFALYEMKIVLATILSRYTLELDSNHRVRPVRRSVVTVTPSGGVKMRMVEKLV